MHGPGEDLVHHWGLSGHPGRILGGPMPPVMHQLDFAKFKAKCGGRTFRPPFSRAQKVDFGFLVDPCTTRPSPRPRIDRRSPCNASDEATRPQAIPTRRRAEGMFIHTRGGAVNRPLAVTWYATGVCSVCRIASRSRWASSERALRVFQHTQGSVPPHRLLLAALNAVCRADVNAVSRYYILYVS